MADGSVKVLFPDGSVCTSPSFTPSKIPASESKLHEHADTSGVNNNEMNSMMKKPGNQLTLKPAVESTKENAVEWLLVNAAGERYRVESNSEESKLNDIIIYRATCPRTQQVQLCIYSCFSKLTWSIINKSLTIKITLSNH